MKYFLFSLFSLLAAISGCTALSARSGGEIKGEAEVETEVFEGVAQGYRGPVSVQVRIRGGSITEIVIVDSMEDRFVGGAAMEELIDLVTEYNSTDVDVITGATESSRGFLEAVENAIMKR